MPAGTLDIFVKLDGIDGESTVRGHENETVCALPRAVSAGESTGAPAPVVKGGWDLKLNKRI